MLLEPSNVLVGSEDTLCNVVTVGIDETGGTVEVKSLDEPEFEASVDAPAESDELVAALDVGNGGDDDDASMLVLSKVSVFVCVDEIAAVGVGPGDPELPIELDGIS